MALSLHNYFTQLKLQWNLTLSQDESLAPPAQLYIMCHITENSRRGSAFNTLKLLRCFRFSFLCLQCVSVCSILWISGTDTDITFPSEGRQGNCSCKCKQTPFFLMTLRFPELNWMLIWVVRYLTSGRGSCVIWCIRARDTTAPPPKGNGTVLYKEEISLPSPMGGLIA